MQEQHSCLNLDDWIFHSRFGPPVGRSLHRAHQNPYVELKTHPGFWTHSCRNPYHHNSHDPWNCQFETHHPFLEGTSLFHCYQLYENGRKKFMKKKKKKLYYHHHASSNQKWKKEKRLTFTSRVGSFFFNCSWTPSNADRGGLKDGMVSKESRSNYFIEPQFWKTDPTYILKSTLSKSGLTKEKEITVWGSKLCWLASNHKVASSYVELSNIDRLFISVINKGRKCGEARRGIGERRGLPFPKLLRI